jgi:hypothetical protein
MSKNRNAKLVTPLNDTTNILPEVRAAIDDLAREGLVYDTGKRRKGQIVWKLTPLGLKVAEES